MTNLIIMIIPILGYNIHFWLLLFLSVSLCRYRFNLYKPLLIVSFTGTAILGFLPQILRLSNPLEIMITFQVVITAWSLLYNLIHRLWKRDIVFLVMEPFLVIGLSRYFFNKFSSTIIMTGLFNWLVVYITIQIILIVVKLSIGYQVSTVVEGKMKKLKLLIYCLPRIEASLSLNDLSAMGVNCAIFPGISNVMIKEVEFLKQKVLALEMRDKDAYEKAVKEHEDYYKKNFVTRIVQKIFSRIR